MLKADEVNDYLADQSKENEAVIHFKAMFHGKELDISPDFVWVFHDKFVDKIKDLV